MTEHSDDQSSPASLQVVSHAMEREYRTRRRTLMLCVALLAVPVVVGVVAVLEGREERQSDLVTRARVDSIQRDYEGVSGQLERLDTLGAIIPELAASSERLERQEAAMTSLAEGQGGLERRIDQTQREVVAFSRSIERIEADIETTGVLELSDELARQKALADGLERSIRDIQNRLDIQERELRVLRLRQDSARVTGSLSQRLRILERQFARQDSTLRLFRVQPRDTIPTDR